MPGTLCWFSLHSKGLPGKMRDLIEEIEKIEKRYKELREIFIRQNFQGEDFQKFAKEYGTLEKNIPGIAEYRKILKEIDEAEHLISSTEDEEIKDLARQEIGNLEQGKKNLEEELSQNILSPDPHMNKNVFMEIRAGAGGEEASLFVSDLFRMYSRYIERRGWKLEVMDSHPTGLGGFKEIIFKVEGKGAYRQLRYESGVHRVQRIPVTEAGDRIHTSTVSVAVLPEAEEVELEIKPEELRIDTFRSSGPGGQHMQKTDSAVRVTHIPTGIVVACQDERSQMKNRMRAMAILRARLLAKKEEEQQKKIAQDRKSQIGTADRSEKIRTYNYPQNRVTDHRINLSLHNLSGILDGNIDELIESLSKKLNI